VFFLILLCIPFFAVYFNYDAVGSLGTELEEAGIGTAEVREITFFVVLSKREIIHRIQSRIICSTIMHKHVDGFTSNEVFFLFDQCLLFCLFCLCVVPQKIGLLYMVYGLAGVSSVFFGIIVDKCGARVCVQSLSVSSPSSPLSLSPHFFVSFWLYF